MTPLLDLRNDLGDFSKDRARRDYRRMSGRVQLFHNGVVRGPYKKATREYWLRRVLEAQQQARELGPAKFQQLELISLPELHEIRRIWLYEKHEFDDSLPGIYEDVLGTPFPASAADDNPLPAEDWEILLDVCRANGSQATNGDGDEEQQAFFELVAGLLDIERQYRGMSRRAGIYEALEDRLRAGQYGSEQEAIAIRQAEEQRRTEAVGVPQPVATVQRSLFGGNGDGGD